MRLRYFYAYVKTIDPSERLCSCSKLYVIGLNCFFALICCDSTKCLTPTIKLERADRSEIATKRKHINILDLDTYLLLWLVSIRQIDFYEMISVDDDTHMRSARFAKLKSIGQSAWSHLNDSRFDYERTNVQSLSVFFYLFREHRHEISFLSFDQHVATLLRTLAFSIECICPLFSLHLLRFLDACSSEHVISFEVNSIAFCLFHFYSFSCYCFNKLYHFFLL